MKVFAAWATSKKDFFLEEEEDFLTVIKHICPPNLGKMLCTKSYLVLPPFEKESPHVWDVHTFWSQGVTFFTVSN